MATGGLRSIVEAAYRLSVPRTQWLEGLSRASEDALGTERGSVALLVDARDNQKPLLLEHASTRTFPGIDRVIEEALASLEPSYVEDAKRPMASHVTEADGMEQPGVRLWLDAFGVPDMLTVMGVDATGFGVLICINQAEKRRSDARASQSLSRLAAHVLCGHNLRGGDALDNDAVFRASGELVHAAESAREPQALDDLARAVRAVVALRSGGTDEALALEAYTARVDATWSVVAEVTDGADEWVVAKRNPSSVLPLPETLSPREAQVMTLLLLGRTPKMVAYELGIAHATVRVLVSRALAKLDAKSVKELAQRPR